MSDRKVRYGRLIGPLTKANRDLLRAEVDAGRLKGHDRNHRWCTEYFLLEDLQRIGLPFEEIA